MSYYPKSQVTTNLYTNGGELTTQQGNPLTVYVGYYWKNSKGQFFTGKTPQDVPTQLLFKLTNTDPEVVTVAQRVDLNVITSIESQPEISTYIKLKNVDVSQATYLPIYSPNIPTQQDYTNGEYRRYFCKKSNEIIYLEISKETYDKLVGKDPQILYQLYRPFNLPWQLTGNKEQVYKTNRNMTELTSVQGKFPMLAEYLKRDFTKYYK